MSAMSSLPILIGLIVVALAFDFLNGLHDSANSIATVVSTRVLRPRTAVVWAAFFNFMAFLLFGVHVAQTIGTGIVAFAATLLGVPVSTTHTITGSVVGVGAARKVSAVRWNVASNIVIAWILTMPASGVIVALFCWLVS